MGIGTEIGSAALGGLTGGIGGLVSGAIGGLGSLMGIGRRKEKKAREADFAQKLEEKKQAVGNKSEGVSSSFGYYPIIFVGDKAFSGFNAPIGEQILAILEEGD